MNAASALMVASFVTDQFPQLVKLRKAAESNKLIAIEDCEWFLQQLLTHEKNLFELNRRSKKSNYITIMYQVEKILRGSASRVVAVVSSLAIRKGVVMKGVMLAKPTIMKSVKKLDLFQPLKGVGKLQRNISPLGKCRLTLSFSSSIVAAQRLVSDVLVAGGVKSNLDCNARKKGTKFAINELRKKIDEGFFHWFSFDIKNCFASIKPKHVSWLPLPKAVLRNVVFVNRYIHIEGCKDTQEANTVRQGLPLGAAPSGIIAGRLIERKLLPIVGENCCAINYADDGAVGARDAATIKGAVETISLSFQGDPAGPLFFSFAEVSRVTDGLCFVGSYIILRPYYAYDRLMVHPNKASRANRNAKVLTIAAKYQNVTFDELRVAIYEYVHRWIKGASAVKPNHWQVHVAQDICLNLALDHGTIFAKNHKPLLGYGASIGA